MLIPQELQLSRNPYKKIKYDEKTTYSYCNRSDAANLA